MSNTSLPRMRTARLLHSLHKILNVSRNHGCFVCVAYVDILGKIRFLWREQEAVLGALYDAECMAWSCVLKATPVVFRQAMTEQRKESHLLYSDCTEFKDPMHQLQGGSLLTVSGAIVGAVGIAGAGIDAELLKELYKVAEIGYLEVPTTATMLKQVDHFEISQFCSL